MECLPGARAREGRGWEKHSDGSKGRYETVSLRSFGRGHGWLQPPGGRPLSWSECFPVVRILPLAKRAEVWVGVPEVCLRLRPETVCPDPPVQGGQSFVLRRP